MYRAGISLRTPGFANDCCLNPNGRANRLKFIPNNGQGLRMVDRISRKINLAATSVKFGFSKLSSFEVEYPPLKGPRERRRTGPLVFVGELRG